MKQIICAVITWLEKQGIKAEISFLYHEGIEPTVCIILPEVKRHELE